MSNGYYSRFPYKNFDGLQFIVTGLLKEDGKFYVNAEFFINIIQDVFRQIREECPQIKEVKFKYKESENPDYECDPVLQNMIYCSESNLEKYISHVITSNIDLKTPNLYGGNVYYLLIMFWHSSMACASDYLKLTDIFKKDMEKEIKKQNKTIIFIL